MISAVVVFIFFIVTSSAHQLRVNAPQVPQFTYATGEGSPATVGATVVGLYAFTADAYSVWGLNIDTPANEQVPFQDSLFGVTQIWGWCGSQGNLNTCRLHVIAGPTLVMYKMNETTVWRASTFTVTNATFNMMSDGTLTAMSPPVVLPYGSGSGSLFVIGTGTVPFFALRASIVYAFDVQSLEIVWTTSLSSDASNFMTKNCSDFVWITTFANSNLTATIVLRKVDWRTGALQDWSFDTQIPQFLELSVAGGQFMALSPFGHVTYGFYNGTSILVDYILSDSCTISIPPALIGMTWYVICGTNVLTWDTQSTVQLPPQTFWNVMCGTVGGGGIVFVTGNAVFLGDDTGNITNVFSISTPATRSLDYLQLSPLPTK
ncbi:membrane-associated protein, putative [Bodo saltans]|uniref:Membrane-associated protein, putative n=1 Tax=Bodo saltans TaxID=75058 RepID=A0A0S4J849_BODSA|nr:membrane-associated protein, putative [Bodo saltans]|eukprot:CUG86499.1 membrane-associated protein, putative [Bodo saltans]